MSSRSRIIFITGTDTGAGNTILTALLLAHLRASGVAALAVKPFCSGDRADAELLAALQNDELAPKQVSPYFCPEPVAPLAARNVRRVPAAEVLDYLNDLAKACECLLIEGIGGLMVPLGRDYTVLDLIARLQCEVLVVARNQLGTLNHTLLTVRALQSKPAFRPARPAHHASCLKVIYMQPRVPDASTASNPRLLRNLLRPIPVLGLPYLGRGCNRPKQILAHAFDCKNQLEKIAGEVRSL